MSRRRGPIVDDEERDSRGRPVYEREWNWVAYPEGPHRYRRLPDGTYELRTNEGAQDSEPPADTSDSTEETGN